MTRVIAPALALILSATTLSASLWPEFPQHPDPVTAQDVKDYWFQALPRPVKPRPLEPFYQSKIKDYQYDVSQGRALIRRLLAGFFDHEARLTALRHNLLLYQAGGLEQQASETEATMELLMAAGPAHVSTSEFPSTSRLGRSSGLRLARLEPSHGLHPSRRTRPTPTTTPSTTPSSAPEPAAPAEPEIIYIEDTDDSQDADDCPPHRPRPPHRPPNRPRPPLDIKPYPQIPNPPSPPARPTRPTPTPRPSKPSQSQSSQSRPSQSQPSQSRPTSYFNRSGRRSR